MRYTGFLLVGLLLAPTVLAGPEGPLGAPERALTAAGDAAGDTWDCLTQAGGQGTGTTQTATACGDAVCSPVGLNIDTLTPVLRPECIEDAVSTVRGLVGI